MYQVAGGRQAKWPVLSMVMPRDSDQSAARQVHAKELFVPLQTFPQVDGPNQRGHAQEAFSMKLPTAEKELFVSAVANGFFDLLMVLHGQLFARQVPLG